MQRDRKTPDGKRPSKTTHPIPSLRQCISSLKRLANELSSLNVKDQSELYVSALAFLCHLKADQATLYEASRRTENGENKLCPPPDKTPAITALAEDLLLFRSLLAMLSLRSTMDRDSSAPMSTPGAPSAASNPTQLCQLGGSAAAGAKMKKASLQHVHPFGRKRSESVSAKDDASENSNKVAKIYHSPKSGIPEWTKNSSVLLMPAASSAIVDRQKKTLPGFNIPVLAATIFYAAFQHMDHWPVPLIRAYAEDCFGPRRWVDDETCSLLTDNLALALDIDSHETILDASTLEEAEKVAAYYATSVDRVKNHLEIPHISPMKNAPVSNGRPLIPRLKSGISSNDNDSSSSDSDSGVEEVVEVSGGAIPKPLSSSKAKSEILPTASTPESRTVATRRRQLDDDSSSSGEEEVEEEGVMADSGQRENLRNDRSTSLQLSSSSLDLDVTSTDAPPDSSSRASSPPPSPPPAVSQAEHNSQTYPFRQEHLDLTRIRPRYVGKNLLHANQAISETLSCRLDAKTKQNSSLLSCLPSFASVPKVRSLTARHLERWLQSPALSGLARSLFSVIVSKMRNVDPPLPEDIEAIDSILAMKLKANQLTAHMDNITSIAKTIPTLSVARHIFLHLLREEMTDVGEGSALSVTPVSDALNTFVAVYSSLPPSLAADALVLAIVNLTTPGAEKPDSNRMSMKREHFEQIKRICVLLRRVANVLGTSYDGYLLVKSFLESGSKMEKNVDVGDAARLAFECMVLMAPPPSSSESKALHWQQSKGQRKGGVTSSGGNLNGRSLGSTLTAEQLDNLRSALSSTRKVMLKWCCTTYAAKLGLAKSNMVTEKHRKMTREAIPAGAGTPDFSSVLDGLPRPEVSDDIPARSLATMRCLLLLAGPESPEMISFLLPDYASKDVETISTEMRYRIELCSEYGADLDDEMMWIVLKSATLQNAGIGSPLALALIEHLFESCQRGRAASLRLTDCNLVWELYRIVEYEPIILDVESISSSEDNSSDTEDRNSGDGRSGEKKNIGNGVNGVLSRKRKASGMSNGSDSLGGPGAAHSQIPRLAYPGMWWRVTALALVMCGQSPKSIGERMWNEHPTLRALMKMTTSGRYRFPTADCDENQRDLMKKAETEMRDKEAQVTELLFLPRSAKAKKKRKQLDLADSPISGGSRMSARQREKQAKLLARQREIEAAEARAEAQRRKKLLRAAQKSIMFWDPRGVARKPPKESVGLILSVDEIFGLSEAFQQCVDPDFLLMTIGPTTRGSIERAYDWLIPIISSHPRIIDRLPPSATCFLLLRAYGADGDDMNQLLELSSPLLRHVSDCLTGKLGQSGAQQRAADLLLVDVADPSPDRRRCARKVLQEALGKVSSDIDAGDSDLESGNCGWLFTLLKVEHAHALVAKAIEYISRALAYERGRVLRALVLALHQYIEFAGENGVDVSCNFASTLCELLSIRPHICSEAMDRFDDFRDLALVTVHQEFERVLCQDVHEGDAESAVAVKLTSWQPSMPTEREKKILERKEAIIPLPLLRAALVLVSNWQERDEPRSAHNEASKVSAPEDALNALVNCLLKIPGEVDNFEEGTAPLAGATSARFANNGKRAVSVDQWVMLAKSRCDFIARLSALSTPNSFLPRLLLCSGLPRSSLITMIDRLGKLGDAASEPSKCYGQLLSPSATVEWGLGPLSRREITRKLLGRLSAYLRVNNEKTDDERDRFSPTFLTWLSQECQRRDKSKSSRLRRAGYGHAGGKLTSGNLHNLLATRSISTIADQEADRKESDLPIRLSDDGNSAIRFSCTQTSPRSNQRSKDESLFSISEDFIKICFGEDLLFLLEERIEAVHFNHDSHMRDRSLDKSTESQVDIDRFSDIARWLLLTYERSSGKADEFTRIVLKWVPLLTQRAGTYALWETLFGGKMESIFLNNKFLLIARCASVWSEDHIEACQQWILSQSRISGGSCGLCQPLLLRFLIVCSGQHSVHKKTFSSAPKSAKSVCGRSHENVAAALAIALECAKLSLSFTGEGNNETMRFMKEESYKSRNMLPDWLQLIVLIATYGKKHLDSITKTIIGHLPSDDWRGIILPVALLRLYSYFPLVMGLEDAKLRSTLIDAASVYASSWLQWRSPLDNEVEEMIANLAKNPHQRLLLGATETAKKHPLVTVRKLTLLFWILEEDASVTKRQIVPERQGRVHGKNVLGPAIARTDDGCVKVDVRHWGYSFTEPLWMSVIDVLLAVPHEVIFSCGLHTGLLELLSVYLRLICVQKDIFQHENTVKIRNKLAALLAAFQSGNGTAWEEWMGSKLNGMETWGHVRDVAVICDLDTRNVEQAKAP